MWVEVLQGIASIPELIKRLDRFQAWWEKRSDEAFRDELHALRDELSAAKSFEDVTRLSERLNHLISRS